MANDDVDKTIDEDKSLNELENVQTIVLDNHALPKDITADVNLSPKQDEALAQLLVDVRNLFNNDGDLSNMDAKWDKLISDFSDKQLKCPKESQIAYDGNCSPVSILNEAADISKTCGNKTRLHYLDECSVLKRINEEKASGLKPMLLFAHVPKIEVYNPYNIKYNISLTAQSIVIFANEMAMVYAKNLASVIFMDSIQSDNKCDDWQVVSLCCQDKETGRIIQIAHAVMIGKPRELYDAFFEALNVFGVFQSMKMFMSGVEPTAYLSLNQILLKQHQQKFIWLHFCSHLIQYTRQHLSKLRIHGKTTDGWHKKMVNNFQEMVTTTEKLKFWQNVKCLVEWMDTAEKLRPKKAYGFWVHFLQIMAHRKKWACQYRQEQKLFLDVVINGAPTIGIIDNCCGSHFKRLKRNVKPIFQSNKIPFDELHVEILKMMNWCNFEITNARQGIRDPVMKKLGATIQFPTIHPGFSVEEDLLDSLNDTEKEEFSFAVYCNAEFSSQIQRKLKLDVKNMKFFNSQVHSEPSTKHWNTLDTIDEGCDPKQNVKKRNVSDIYNEKQSGFSGLKSHERGDTTQKKAKIPH